jgi:putative tryptophan/tyrosine transport system substrate-binding protein
LKRRDVITGLGGVAIAGASFAGTRAVAQPARPFVIGGLSPATELIETYFRAPLRAVMKTLGWEEGREYTLLALSDEGRDGGLAALARELVARRVDVLAALGDVAIRAAQHATQTMPIAGITDDMLGSGLVASMARPGGNTTGVSILASELDVKRLELLHELVPQAARVGALADPTTVSTRLQLETAARHLGIELVFFTAGSPAQIRAAIEAIAAAGIGGLNVLASPVLYAGRSEIIAAVARLRVVAIFCVPEASNDGGLVAYGARLSLCYHQLATLIVKILKGAKPADLPVEQPVKIDLVINLKTAKSLGLTISPSILARADEVIE